MRPQSASCCNLMNFANALMSIERIWPFSSPYAFGMAVSAHHGKKVQTVSGEFTSDLVVCPVLTPTRSARIARAVIDAGPLFSALIVNHLQNPATRGNTKHLRERVDESVRPSGVHQRFLDLLAGIP